MTSWLVEPETIFWWEVSAMISMQSTSAMDPIGYLMKMATI